MGGMAQAAAVNLRRMLRCCEAMVSDSTQGIDPVLLGAYLEEARGLLHALPDTTPTAELRLRVKALEPLVRTAEPFHTKRRAVLATKKPDPTIPPPTVEAAVDSAPPDPMGPERGLRRRHKDDREGTPAAATTADATGLSPKPDDEAVIGELAGLVSVFRDRALSMGMVLKQDVKAIEDTESLMQSSLGKLQGENARLKAATATGWRQMIIFSVLLAIATLLFAFMVFVILLFRKKR